MDSEDIVRKFHQKRGRIRDPRSGIRKKIHPGSRIQGVKKHRIPDPQHCSTVYSFMLKSVISDVSFRKLAGSATFDFKIRIFCDHTGIELQHSQCSVTSNDVQQVYSSRKAYAVPEPVKNTVLGPGRKLL
jgi:hypothetical protein